MVVQLLGGPLHAQAEVGLEQFGHFLLQPGKVLYEINGVPEALAREAFQLASAKLPLRTTFVARQVGA